jgi:hypothetical protein
MSDLAFLLDKCRRLGLELFIEGDRIGIAPKERIPIGLLEEIREVKPSLLAVLRDAQMRHLAADCIPWLHIARQVLDGEFTGADRSTIKSLTIGLRAVAHPLCRRALDQLNMHSPT